MEQNQKSQQKGSSDNDAAAAATKAGAPAIAASSDDHLHHEENYIYRDLSHIKASDLPEEDERAAALRTLPAKLNAMLSDPALKDVITWLPHGRSWRVLDRDQFTDEVLPTYFEHSNYQSFVRLVNAWGFRRVPFGIDGDSYYHELFLRGMPHLHAKMKRLLHSERKTKIELKNRCPNFYGLPIPDGVSQNGDEHGSKVSAAESKATNPLQAGVNSTSSTDVNPNGGIAGSIPPHQYLQLLTSPKSTDVPLPVQGLSLSVPAMYNLVNPHILPGAPAFPIQLPNNFQSFNTSSWQIFPQQPNTLEQPHHLISILSNNPFSMAQFAMMTNSQQMQQQAPNCNVPPSQFSTSPINFTPQHPSMNNTNSSIGLQSAHQSHNTLNHLPGLTSNNTKAQYPNAFASANNMTCNMVQNFTQQSALAACAPTHMTSTQEHDPSNSQILNPKSSNI